MKRFGWLVVSLTVVVGGCSVIVDDELSAREGQGLDAGLVDSGQVDSGPVDSGQAQVDSGPGDADAGPGCGNGVVDPGEDCDDGNLVGGDGCESDCTFSCVSDEDCEQSACVTSTCDVERHVCVTTEVDCDDGNDCTEDSCDPEIGCVNTLIDEDGDGHAPIELGECGDDCDDTDPFTYPGAPELCEPSGVPPVDNDCDPSTPNPTTNFWYPDCDQDGYAAAGTAPVESCEEPAMVGDCRWTTRVPTGPSSIDCNDENADMFPGQTTYFLTPHGCSGCTGDERFKDYDCNGEVNRSRSVSSFGVSTSASCELRVVLQRGEERLVCTGTAGWVSSTQPACGYEGEYSSCGQPEICRGSDAASCRGYQLVCVGASSRPGDPCYCKTADPRDECSPNCTPGQRGCPWGYARCPSRAVEDRSVGCR